MTQNPARQPAVVLAPFASTSFPRPSQPVPRRTNRSSACLACRTRRIKCGGNHPCDNCVANSCECVFVRDSDKRRKFAFRKIERELKIANQVLDDVVTAFNAGDRVRLDALLAIARDYRLGQETHTAAALSTIFGGFLEDMGELTDDLNRDDASRAAGYFGKSSAIAWLQKLGATVNNLNVNKEQQHSVPIEVSATSMSYHLDHIQIPDTIPPLEPRCLPTKPWATHLLCIFFKSVAPSFPLINKALFIDQFNQAFDRSNPQPPRKWLAVLNLVLAVGCRYYLLSQPVPEGDVNDRVFLSRAIALMSSTSTTTQDLGLHQVQIDLLLAIYHLSSGQVNQSWQANGRAARLAVSMGLNLRSGSTQIDPVAKETRSRIWWSIVTLEHSLSCLTGRTSCVDYNFITAHLPLPFDEDQFARPGVSELLTNLSSREAKLQLTIHLNNSEINEREQWLKAISPSQSLYFFHLVDLSVIMNAATKAVYNPTATKRSIQSNIPFYQDKLQLWISSLQPALSFAIYNADVAGPGFSDPAPANTNNTSREQVSLAIAYYSSQMVLNRPCLAELDTEAGTNAKIPRSHFEDRTAKSCVHFALALISVLPNQPDIKWVANMTLSWSLLHSIMQALTILLIQLSIGLVPVMSMYGKQQTSEANDGEGAEEVREASKKALLWLHSMAERDASSRRAFHISKRLFHAVTPSQAWLDLQDIEFAEAAAASMGAGGPGITHEKEHAHKFSHVNPLNGLGPSSLNLPENFVNWGPDCTATESVDTEMEEVPRFLDPVLLSFNSYEF
ncbi:fungal-specific transcription factor domain-containing protein [Aspergillus heterothallicus]